MNINIFKPRTMLRIVSISGLVSLSFLASQPSKAVNLVEDQLKAARTAPAGAIPFDDSFNLYLTYDKDQVPTDSTGISPTLLRPYTFTGYSILSVRGTYTNPSGETYDIPLLKPTPVGSVQRNPGGTSSGIDDLASFPTTSTFYRSFWELGAQGNPSDKYPADLTDHNITDNLYNPSGGFAPGDLLAGRTNGTLSFGGLQFFVDYGPNFAADAYPNRYMPYQFFFKDLANDDSNGEDYAGCPGDCGNAKVTKVPGPLPLLGIAAAFGYSRKIRSRINKGYPRVKLASPA
jgi:hypothetical protein